MTELTFLGISGSLRAGSHNSALVAAAAELAPPGITVQRYGRLRDIPPYDADQDGPAPPEPVADLRARIAAADGLLIATPEYNSSMPGVLKNALDWGSRPKDASVLSGKPVATLGAASGTSGTIRAQLALRQVWVWTGSPAVVKPEVHVFRAAEHFDERGRLSHPATRAQVRALLAALRELVLRERVALGRAT